MSSIISKLVCTHDYELVSIEKGVNGLGVETIRRHYKCKKCLNEIYEDELIGGW